MSRWTPNYAENMHAEGDRLSVIPSLESGLKYSGCYRTRSGPLPPRSNSSRTLSRSYSLWRHKRLVNSTRDTVVLNNFVLYISITPRKP